MERVHRRHVFLRGCLCSKGSLVLSLVRQARTWSPRHLHLSHLPCLSLSQAAAASRASGHSRPQPPSHIEHPPPPPPLFFFLFYTVTSSRWTGSALATPPLTPSPEVSGTTERARRHTLSSIYLAASDISSVSLCAPHMQGRLPKECKHTFMQHFARPDNRKCV